MRKLSVILALVVGFLCAPAPGQFHKGDGDLQLGAVGASDKNFDDTVFAGSLSVGTLVTSNFELGVRQDVAYDGSFSGASAVFTNFNLNLGKLSPFIGGSVGSSYGQATEADWFAGPEAGLRVFISDRTYLYGRVAYKFDIQQGFDDGGFGYTVGIGTRW